MLFAVNNSDWTADVTSEIRHTIGSLVIDAIIQSLNLPLGNGRVGHLSSRKRPYHVHSILKEADQRCSSSDRLFPRTTLETRSSLLSAANHRQRPHD